MRNFAFLMAELAANPSLADRYDRVQRLDARIAAAMREVPVADDLADRLLARLTSKKSMPEVSRRWLLAGSGLLATAVGLLVAVWLGFPGSKPLSEQYVLDEAIRFFGNSQAESQHWLSELPPDEYPFTAMLLPGRDLRWQAITDFWGTPAWLTISPGQTRSGPRSMWCLALRKARDPRPALQPFTTAGCSASAWRENGLLYIFVVQGDPAAYQSHLRLPTGPIA